MFPLSLRERVGVRVVFLAT